MKSGLLAPTAGVQRDKSKKIKMANGGKSFKQSRKRGNLESCVTNREGLHWEGKKKGASVGNGKSIIRGG